MPKQRITDILMNMNIPGHAICGRKVQMNDYVIATQCMHDAGCASEYPDAVCYKNKQTKTTCTCTKIYPKHDAAHAFYNNYLLRTFKS